jgi:hypothetical protein
LNFRRIFEFQICRLELPAVLIRRNKIANNISGGFCPPQNFRRFYLNFRRLFKFQIFRLKLPAVLKPPQMPLFEKNFPLFFPAVLT